MAENEGAKKKGGKGKSTGAKGQGGGKGKSEGKGKNKKKNPLVLAARKDFLEKLRGQGGSDDEMKQKLKVHMKDVVRPAMTAAKTAADSKKLAGPERKKFVQDAVRAKLGLAVQ
jgi:hypothetical protein